MHPQKYVGMYTAAYGVTGYHSDVDNEVYDAHQADEIDKTKIKMLVPLEMNNQRILNSPNITPNMFVYKKGGFTINGDNNKIAIFRPNNELLSLFGVIIIYIQLLLNLIVEIIMKFLLMLGQ